MNRKIHLISKRFESRFRHDKHAKEVDKKSSLCSLRIVVILL